MVKFLWHMVGHGWDRIIERIEDDKLVRPTDFKSVHQRFLHKFSNMDRKRRDSKTN